jgi:hypothetical protein
MNSHHTLKYLIIAVIAAIMLTALPVSLKAQQRQVPGFVIGIHADPIISWFGSDNPDITNKGTRPGINFGVSVFRYFGPNYAFSTGISLISAGGRLVNNTSDTTIFYSTDAGKVLRLTKVSPGQSIVYKIQYLSIPLGLKLQTNQIGYMTFFTDIGVDPKIVIAGKANIPSVQSKDLSALEELRVFNMSYHVIAGIEYGVGGNTAIVLGLGFDNNFFDITREKGTQPPDKISHKLLSFRLGVNF